MGAIITKLESNKQNYEPIANEIYKMMSLVHNILIGANIPYCIFGETLLGAVQNGSIIPWDDDIDIFILDDYEKYLPIIGIVLQQYGYQIKKYDYPDRYIVSLINDNISKSLNYPHIDIFIYKKQFGLGYVFANESNQKLWPQDIFQTNDLFPLRIYQFGPLTLLGPNNPFPYLTSVFGT
jgi:lipopolysaccharide cholinephosphotransferase